VIWFLVDHSAIRRLQALQQARSRHRQRQEEEVEEEKAAAAARTCEKAPDSTLSMTCLTCAGAYVFHKLVFFFHSEFSFSSPPLSLVPPPFQLLPAALPPPPPRTLANLLSASPPQLGRLHPQEGETTQTGLFHLSSGSPPCSDLVAGSEGRSTPPLPHCE